MELTNALLGNDDWQADSSLGATIVGCNAHDVCQTSRDRDFRALGFFLSATLLDLKGGGAVSAYLTLGDVPTDMTCRCVCSQATLRTTVSATLIPSPTDII